MEKQEALPSTEDQLELPFTDYVQTPEEMVREFITAFDANTDPAFAVKLIREEAKELREALAHTLKELSDFIYVSLYSKVVGTPDGFADTDEDVESAFRILEALGCILSDKAVREAFARVHRSNMSKLGDDGKPVRREDGKILKGPNYQEPYLLDLV